jgi:hypothetical protein
LWRWRDAPQLALTFAVDESTSGTSTQMGTVTNQSAVAWAAEATGAQTSCLASGYFALTPPDDTSVVTATDVIHVCGAITISPFQNAPFIAS